MKGIAVLRKLAAQQTMKQFAARHHFVYFGNVDARNDEHELVRGVTASASHSDSHYTVGTFQGHDLMFVERHNTLTYPGKPSSAYVWVILTLDLKRSDLPHIFIDARHHDETFYANLKLGFAKLHDLSGLVPSLGKTRIFAPPDSIPLLQVLLSPDFVAGMHNFNQFDYEIKEDQVFIYASNSSVNIRLLDDMLRVGLWLAAYLNDFKESKQEE